MAIERPPMLLFFGLPGSGKSTAAMKLEQQLEGYRRFSPDETRRELGITCYRKRDTPKVLGYIAMQVRARLEEGLGVILDSAFPSSQARQYFYNLAYDCGADVVSTYVRCNEQTSLARIRQRPKDDGLHMPGRTARMYYKYRRGWERRHPEYKTFEEGYELIGYSSDVNLMINRHVAVLRYDTDANTIEIKDKYLRPELRRHAARVKEILLQA